MWPASTAKPFSGRNQNVVLTSIICLSPDIRGWSNKYTCVWKWKWWVASTWTCTCATLYTKSLQFSVWASVHWWILANLPRASFPASPLVSPPFYRLIAPPPPLSETAPWLSAVAEVWRSAPPAHASASAPKPAFPFDPNGSEWMEGVSFLPPPPPSGVRWYNKKRFLISLTELNGNPRKRSRRLVLKASSVCITLDLWVYICGAKHNFVHMRLRREFHSKHICNLSFCFTKYIFSSENPQRSVTV